MGDDSRAGSSNAQPPTWATDASDKFPTTLPATSCKSKCDLGEMAVPKLRAARPLNASRPWNDVALLQNLRRIFRCKVRQVGDGRGEAEGEGKKSLHRRRSKLHPGPGTLPRGSGQLPRHPRPPKRWSPSARTRYCNGTPCRFTVRAHKRAGPSRGLRDSCLGSS